MTASTGDCDACRRIIGLWQAVFTSECAHTFHLRCVSGTAACPVCAARWTDTPPATAPAPAPATPYTFASSASRTPLFGQPPSSAQNSSSCFWSPSPTPISGQQQHRRCAPAAPLCPACHGAMCPVCHGAMRRGQATVTSECNHTFHLRCIASHDYCATRSAACPICRARWRDCVSLQALPQPSVLDFGDDEPPPPPPPSLQEVDVVQLKTHCEHPAVARDTARDSFAVLVHAKAPAATPAPPLDIVTVLDVSGSMAGYKLALLKQATSLVIDRLGPRDRLSVVAFSCEARRVLGLTRMSDGGKATAKAAVESLVTRAGTDIGGGLRVAAGVLDGRRHRNAAGSVILLSDGKDNHNYHHPMCISGISRYSGLAPQSLRRTAGCPYPPPVHMLGLGTDHDAEAMHAIARVTRGTFSAAVKEEDLLAQCIGGLRSVAVRDARVVVECLHPGVNVRAVKAAGGSYYPSLLIDRGGRAASVDVGELYADEERRFLLFLGLPKDDGDGDGSVTRLVKVSCTYKDAATGRSVDVCCKDDAAVLRPVEVPATMTTGMGVEVARECFRVEAAEDVAVAQDAAKHGEHARAAQILERRLEAAAGLELALAGDDRCAELAAKLRELSARVEADRREYEQSGRASRVPLFGSTPSPAPAGSTSTVQQLPGTPAGPPATGGFLVSYGPFRGEI